MTKPDRERLAETGATAPVVQIAAMVVGTVFLLFGIAGFIPGITSDFDELSWAGHHSGALLLGIFAVSVLHNIVHLAFGVAGLVLARSATTARAYLLFGGAAYAALWLYGVSIDHDGPLNVVPVNTADNWLHLGLAVLMLVSGVLFSRLAVTSGPAPTISESRVSDSGRAQRIDGPSDIEHRRADRRRRREIDGTRTDRE